MDAMTARSIDAVFLVSIAVQAAGTDKTLVSSGTLADRGIPGGSVLSVQAGDAYDGIVFGESAPDRWTAGSDFLRRTQRDHRALPAETTDGKAPLQMAIVYGENRITTYRNGEVYASYPAVNAEILNQKDGSVEVFANDRQAAVAAEAYKKGNVYARLFADGG